MAPEKRLVKLVEGQIASSQTKCSHVVKELMLSVALLSCATLFADEWLWIGPYDPSSTSSTAPFANSANWSNMVTGVAKKGYPNSATDIAVFDGDARLRCANSAGDQKFGGMKILSGTVTFLSYYDIARQIQFAADTNVVFIADGAALKLTGGPSIAGIESGKQVVVVTGPGDIQWSGKSTVGSLLKDFVFKDFHGGSLTLTSSMGDNSVVNLRVADGMTVTMGAYNKIGDSAVIRVDKGGTFNFNNQGDSIGAFEGDGTILLGERVWIYMPGGPYAFGGRCTGTLKVLGTASDENRHFLLTSTNAFAETAFNPSAVSGHRLLQFAPGVGEFVIGAYTPAAGQDILLEDTDGNPVTVKMALGNSSTKTLSGSGNFTYTGTGTATYQANALDHTGWINVANGTVQLGNSTEASDAPLEQYAGFGLLSSSAALYFQNAAKVTINQPIEGSGLLVAAGPADFSAFRRQTGTFVVSSDVKLDSPAAKQSAIDVQGSGHLTLNGGMLEGVGTGNAAYVNLTGASDEARLTVSNGAKLAAGALSVRTIDVADSTVNIPCAALANCGTTAKPHALTFDNATVVIGNGGLDSADTNFGSCDTANAHRRVFVKEGGLTLLINEAASDYGCSVMAFDSGAEPGVSDGGLTVEGHGRIRFDGALGVTGPVRFLGANSQINFAGMTTVGDLVLGTAKLSGGSATFVTRADGAVSLIGAMTIQPAESGLYTFGPEGAGKDSVFTREQGGVLFVRATKGVPTTVKVNGGVSDNAAGVSKLPVITWTENRADGNSTSRGNLQFARFGEDGVLENVYGTAWSDALTASDIALVDDMTAEKQVTANQAVGGLRVFGSKKTGTALSIAQGAVLTVGSGADPACILLNNSHANGSQAVIGGAGTIDFGPREGIIVANQRQYDTYPGAINCKIAGTGGLTFAGAQSYTLISLGGANDYDGGTFVESVSVQAANGSCFGRGTVTIPMTKSCGGEVVFSTAATFANDFKVGGFGNIANNGTFDQGALWFSSSAALTGSVELLGETNIGGEMNIRGTLDGAVTGSGPLTVRGSATLAFGAANTFTGGLSVESSATVEVKEGATLGADEVTVKGVLRFVNETDIVVPNVISGTGTIELAGKGNVMFVDKSGFTGRIVLKSGAVADLTGEDLVLTSLDGASVVTNSGVAATLAVNGEALSLFTGVVAGPVSLVKRGDRTQAIAGEMTYEGTTTIENGTLRLGDYETFETLPVTDDLVRLDAAVGVTLVDGDDSKVASWSDADGKGMTFANTLPKADATPAWATVAEAACGPALRFGAQDWVRLVGDGAMRLRTFFGVYTFANGSHLGGTFAELFGSNGVDSGIRINGNAFVDNSSGDSINGQPGRQVVAGATQLFMREYGSNQSYDKPAVSGYSGNKRPWYGDIHEIVVYGRVLNDTEREAVNDYLMVKWGIRTTKKTTEKLVDVLPTATDLTISEAGTFDLGGCDQTLASLVCLGSLTNDSPRCATLTLAGDSSVGANASFGAPNLDLVLGPGVTLNLGGGTFTIRRLINDDGGHVVNGTLNELKPRRGMLLIVR